MYVIFIKLGNASCIKYLTIFLEFTVVALQNIENLKKKKFSSFYFDSEKKMDEEYGDGGGEG